MTEQIEIPNITINEITLINTITKVSFAIFPRDNNEPYIFDTLVLDEDMFSESVSGTLYFYDPAFIVEQLNFTSYDIIKIRLSSPTLNGRSKEVQFKIVEIISQANAVSKKIMGPYGNVVPVAVRFASDQLIHRNFDTTLLKSFIGKISNDPNNSNKSTTLVDNLSECDPKGDLQKNPGFIQYIFDEYGKDKDKGDTTNAQKSLVADNTYNDMWFKINPSHYPWSKIGAAPKIGQMMNYVCEYACYGENPNAVNFFFWEDLDQFNFRCIESLLKENNKTPIATYTPSLNDNDIDAFVDLQLIEETPIAKLVNNGAFSGEYIRVKPDWYNPYRLVVDTAASVKRAQIVYDYFSDKDAFEKISTYPPVDPENISVVYAPNRITDANYGYYQDAYNQKQTPWWNYWDPSYKHYEGQQIGTEEVERIENNYWQAQFDFSELPGTCLKTIYEKIKWPLSKARLNYANLKRAKTKWEFYRNTILGERKTPTSFYALLTGTSLLYLNEPGGIYSYSFTEVEFFPWYESETGTLWRNIYSCDVVPGAGAYPFRVVTVPWGIKGTAYNLNELLNSTLPESNTTFIGPGIGAEVKNAQAVPNSYPSTFSMQPVGRVFNKDVEGAVIPQYVGRIVKIDVVEGKMLDVLASVVDPAKGGALQPKGTMYVFDVENANDGICSTPGSSSTSG